MAMSADSSISSSRPVSSAVNVWPLPTRLPRSQVPTPASMIQTMLPNQPLPMETAFTSIRPGSIVVTASTISTPTSLHYTTGFGTTVSHPTHLFPSNPVVSPPLHSLNMVTVTTGPPRLPQHPLTQTTSSTTKIEPVELQQQPQLRTVVALKKREFMMAKDPTLKNQIKSKEKLIVGMAKASIQSQPEYLNPRDTYGGGPHLRLQQVHQQ